MRVLEATAVIVAEAEACGEGKFEVRESKLKIQLEIMK